LELVGSCFAAQVIKCNRLQSMFPDVQNRVSLVTLAPPMGTLAERDRRDQALPDIPLAIPCSGASRSTAGSQSVRRAGW
jgi:hypothetical protein